VGGGSGGNAAASAGAGTLTYIPFDAEFEDYYAANIAAKVIAQSSNSSSNSSGDGGGGDSGEGSGGSSVRVQYETQGFIGTYLQVWLSTQCLPRHSFQTLASCV
jgi:hypothetical protein